MTLTLQDLAIIQDIVMGVAGSADRCTFLGYKDPAAIQAVNRRLQEAMSGVKIKLDLILATEVKKEEPKR